MKKKYNGEIEPGMHSARESSPGLWTGDPGDIASWVRRLKFRKKLFGGVDEDDVLRKMEELNRLYETALLCERARFEELLQSERDRGSGSAMGKSGGDDG